MWRLPKLAVTTTLLVVLCLLIPRQSQASPNSQAAFQPFNAQGNTIHVETADFDGVGAKEYVVAAMTNGTVVAYSRPDTITDPAADNRMWTVDTGAFVFMVGTAKPSKWKGARDHILLPGVDGKLRVINAMGVMVLNLDVGATSGAVYCADGGFDSQERARIVAGSVDGNVYMFDFDGNKVGAVQPRSKGSIVRR
jgi:hypothetical protein